MKKNFVKGLTAAMATGYTAAFTGVMSSFVGAADCSASNPTGCLGSVSTSVGPNTDLLAFIQQTLNFVIGLAALVAVGFLIYSGIQYIVSAGDEKKVQNATNGITYAIIGLVVCFIAGLIVNFVLNQILGVGK